MRKIGKVFLTGLATLLPAVVTLWLAIWLVVSAESGLGSLVRLVLPDEYYIPGTGVVLAVGLVFGVGLLTQTAPIRRLFGLGGAIMDRIPLVKTVYGAFRDLVQFITGDKKDRFNKVVMVRPTKDPEVELLGFVTREDFSGLPEGIGGEDRIAVYMPMSYQVGGYTLFIPRDRIRAVDISMEDAMRMALTAGMSVKRDDIG
ncbi:DUF502 domain-containing protein [Natronospira bacteriovora]|uniref:DUF502 domain-containing protein n=1 Tax=Natronospira bacteriovora TaxID=3069753 RepID=A0ABU0W9W2_9GAMM|nr:DUF502 domain-containing protein [Natronospira sp. AB-CW4]MDQ2070225.1 DUF502 domain-containing protein [Natronospira sp. AB-CW4]